MRHRRMGQGERIWKKKILWRMSPFCARCGKIMTRKKATIDHIIPKSKIRNAPHRIENLQLLCEACNLAKRDTFTAKELRQVAENMRNNR